MHSELKYLLLHDGLSRAKARVQLRFRGFDPREDGHCPTRIFRRQVVTLSKPTYQVLPPWSAGVWSSRWPRPDMLNRYIVTNVMCDIVPDIVSDIVPDIASDVVVYLR